MLLCVVLVVVPCSADLWQPEQLPFTLDGGTSVGFAVDSSGAPGFTFRTLTGSSPTTGLYYGYQSAGSWTSELVQTGGGTGAGSYLLYDGTTPYISYGAGGPFDIDLTVATGGPGAWSTTTLVDTDHPRHTMLGLDANGNLGLGWIDQVANQLGYIYHDGADWSSPEIVDTQPRVLAGLSVLLPGSVEDASIAYSQFDGTFFYAPTLASRQSDDDWDLDVGLGGTATFDDAGYLAGVVTDSGNPALCFMDTWTGNIVYTEFDGTTWHSETVVELETLTTYADDRYLDMARDDWGNIHLLYLNTDTRQVEYRFRTSEGDWSGARVLHQGESTWMRLAIDDTQAPWFAYYSRDDERLHYGVGAPVPEPATTALFAMGLLSAIGFARRNRKTSGREQS